MNFENVTIRLPNGEVLKRKPRLKSYFDTGIVAVVRFEGLDYILKECEDPLWYEKNYEYYTLGQVAR